MKPITVNPDFKKLTRRTLIPELIQVSVNEYDQVRITPEIDVTNYDEVIAEIDYVIMTRNANPEDVYISFSYNGVNYTVTVNRDGKEVVISDM